MRKAMKLKNIAPALALQASVRAAGHVTCYLTPPVVVRTTQNRAMVSRWHPIYRCRHELADIHERKNCSSLKTFSFGIFSQYTRVRLASSALGFGFLLPSPSRRCRNPWLHTSFSRFGSAGCIPCFSGFFWRPVLLRSTSRSTTETTRPWRSIRHGALLSRRLALRER
uniref:Putative secreted protein n=1 Tax=Ixodes ricinus TaxID=34613 RepID=A0A6B0UZN2_IXORI